MEGANKVFGPVAIFLFWFLVLNLVPRETVASEHDTLIARLREDNWHVYFSNDGQRLNRSFDALLELANNRGLDWRIRIRCITLLSETSDPRRGDVLVGMFRDDFFNSECPAIKTSIISALGAVHNDQRVVDALIDGMNDRELQVREAAIQSLGRLRNERAVPFLINRLSDGNFSIRMSVVRSLGQIRDPKAIPFLKNIAAGDPDDLIRSEAATALAKMKSQKKFDRTL